MPSRAARCIGNSSAASSDAVAENLKRKPILLGAGLRQVLLGAGSEHSREFRIAPNVFGFGVGSHCDTHRRPVDYLLKLLGATLNRLIKLALSKATDACAAMAVTMLSASAVKICRLRMTE